MPYLNATINIKIGLWIPKSIKNAFVIHSQADLLLLMCSYYNGPTMWNVLFICHNARFPNTKDMLSFGRSVAQIYLYYLQSNILKVIEYFKGRRSACQSLLCHIHIPISMPLHPALSHPTSFLCACLSKRLLLIFSAIYSATLAHILPSFSARWQQKIEEKKWSYL